MHSRPAWILVLLLGLSLAAPVAAQEDVGPGAPSFKEGDVITIDRIEELKPFLPPEFWSNRDFFFYEGMQLEIGPFFRDYSGPKAFKAATEPGESFRYSCLGYITLARIVEIVSGRDIGEWEFGERLTEPSSRLGLGWLLVRLSEPQRVPVRVAYLEEPHLDAVDLLDRRR